MTLDLTCQTCDTTFELDVTELLDEPRLQCPSCDARVPRPVAESLSSTLDDLLVQLARLRSKFQVVFEVDSDDLPPVYETGRAHAAEDDEPIDEELDGTDDAEERERDAED